MNFFTIFSALRQGATLTHASAWANTTAAVSALTGVVWAALQIAKGFGYALPITPEQINAMAAGMVAVVSVIAPILHIASNPLAGMSTEPGPDGLGQAGQLDSGPSR